MDRPPDDAWTSIRAAGGQSHLEDRKANRPAWIGPLTTHGPPSEQPAASRIWKTCPQQCADWSRVGRVQRCGAGCTPGKHGRGHVLNNVRIGPGSDGSNGAGPDVRRENTVADMSSALPRKAPGISRWPSWYGRTGTTATTGPQCRPCRGRHRASAAGRRGTVEQVRRRQQAPSAGPAENTPCGLLTRWFHRGRTRMK